MKPFNLSLYLVLDAIVCGNREALLHTAEKALAAGITCLQLRGDKIGWSKRDWYNTALALKPMCAKAGVAFIINDQIDIALATDADGVHIGQSDLPATVARHLLGKDKIIGLSTCNIAQVKAAAREPVDYIGIGPVYPTTSKTNAPPALGLAGLQTLLTAKTLPGVAIGGINAERAKIIRKLHPEGIAVVSAICGQANIKEAVQQLQDL